MRTRKGRRRSKRSRPRACRPVFSASLLRKGHDDDLLLGADIKSNGAKDDLAKAITDAVRIDVLSMQALYGKAHAH
ncbi:MAG: hypothetical protein IPN51_14645 [Chloracidobacterium sp.]|nr:hypothetical protein [Chloracidobacterium sp.]